MPRGNQNRATIEREHAATIANLCALDVCEGCGGALEDVTYEACDACRARDREDGPRMHRYAEERVRTKVQCVLACSPVLYFANGEGRSANWAAPMARAIAASLARPGAVIRNGRDAATVTIAGLLRLGGIDERAAQDVAGLIWDEYIGALEEHARVQRYECRRYVDNGRARLALTVHAVQLEGWAERLRAMDGGAR